MLFGVLCYIAFHYVIMVEEGHLTSNFRRTVRNLSARGATLLSGLGAFTPIWMTVSVKPWALYRTFGDGLFFLVAYPFFEFVEHLQTTGMLPVLLHLY